MATQIERQAVLNYTDHVSKLAGRIKNIQNRIDECKARLELKGVSYEKLGSSGSSSPDGIPNAIILIEEITKDLEPELEDLLIEERVAHRVFRSLSDPRACTVCVCRFMERGTWVNAGNSIGETSRNAMIIYDKAIPEIYKTMPEKWRDSLPKAL